MESGGSGSDDGVCDKLFYNVAYSRQEIIELHQEKSMVLYALSTYTQMI